MMYDQGKNKVVCHYCKREQHPVTTCPKCTSSMVKLRGAGTQLVETTLQTLLGETNTHEITRIDGDIEKIEHAYDNRKKSRIIIGTEKAFRHVRWEKTDLIIFIDIDRQLALPEFLATESVWHIVQQAQFRRHDTSSFFIQTKNPEHTFFQSLGDTDSFYKAELHTRHRLAYPPYSYLVRYFYGHQNKQAAALEAEKVYTTLKNALTEEKKPIRLHNPIAMHPTYYRKKYWYAILVKITPMQWEQQILWLNAHIPPRWKIDPNPISILSP